MTRVLSVRHLFADDMLRRCCKAIGFSHSDTTQPPGKLGQQTSRRNSGGLLAGVTA
jgi:hypothetical protein